MTQAPQGTAVQLWLQVVSAVTTLIATGAVVFDSLSAVINHDVASMSLLIATACNAGLIAIAARAARPKKPTPPTDFDSMA
jgi:hypothetical protein